MEFKKHMSFIPMIHAVFNTILYFKISLDLNRVIITLAMFHYTHF